MSDPRRRPVGVVLAGGAGRRLRRAKALAPLRGRPLIAYPLAALRAVLGDVVVLAKPSTPLPPLEVAVWLEPEEPRHPLTGIVEALQRAAGRPVLVCAVDLPLVTPVAIEELAAATATAVAADGHRLQPLLGLYMPAALPALRTALAAEARMTDVAEAIGADRIELARDMLFNVNVPADLVRAAELLASRT